MPKKSFAAARGKSDLLRKPGKSDIRFHTEQDDSENSSGAESDRELNELGSGVFNLKQTRVGDLADDADSDPSESDSDEMELPSVQRRNVRGSFAGGRYMIDHEVPMDAVRAKLEKDDDVYAAVKLLQRQLGREDNTSKSWGADKDAYFGADTAELMADDEEDAQAAAEEEQEVKRLQRIAAKRTKEADFQIVAAADGSSSESEDEESGDDQEVDRGGRSTESVRSATPASETAGAKRGVASRAERLRILQRDAPELIGLLRELQHSAAQVRQRVLPAATALQRQGIGHSVGAAYLEAKQQLLLAYVTHISFFLLLRAEGHQVRTHPVMARLVQIRSLLDRLRTVDDRMRGDVDRLLLAGATATLSVSAGGTDGPRSSGQEGAAAESSLRPQIGSLVPHGTSHTLADEAAIADQEDMAEGDDDIKNEDEESGTVYKPLKRVAVPFEEGGGGAREEMRRQRASDGLRRSELLQEMREAVSSRPEESTQGSESNAARRLKELDAAQQAYEDEHFGHVTESKAGKKLRRKLEREAQKVDILGGLGDLDELQKVLGDGGAADRDGDEIDLREEEELLVRGGTRRGRVTLAERRKRLSGKDQDADVSGRLLERLSGVGDRRQPVDLSAEDGDMIAAAQAIAKARKQRKQEATDEAKVRRHAAVAGTLQEAEREGPRGVSREIMKNKGLTKYRRKDERNPRVKYRKKAERAVKKRKSQVPEMRGGERDRYAGETTGIRVGLQRSHKLD